MRGVFVCGGHFRNGLAMAPASAAEISAQLAAYLGGAV
jgi:glycine/D-amino acid oxidase-like deaminating enzyme